MKFVVLILLFFICMQTNAVSKTDYAPIKLAQKQVESFGIAVAELKLAPDVLGESYPAHVVVPNTQVQVVSSRLQGLVESLTVAEGERVEAGQLLGRIQSPALLELQRELLQTLIQLNLAYTTMDRDRQLMEEGIVPKRRYQESLSAWQALKTQKQQQLATLQFSGMSVKDIQTLENKRTLNSVVNIVAPFTGVILEQMAIPGQKLEAADPIFKLAQLSPLWLEIHVPVNVVKNINVGDVVALSDMGNKAEVITIGSQVHRADQGTLVRALVNNEKGTLRPGQFIQARLSQQTDTQYHYLLPDKALIRQENNSLIFIEKDAHFIAVSVDLIGRHEGRHIIATKEVLTEPVVISGAISLKALLSNVDAAN